MSDGTWGHHPDRLNLSRQVYQRDRATFGYLCPRCGNPIDWELPYKDPETGQVNLWSKSVDHLHEIQDGGSVTDVDNMATTHLRCNSSKGAQRRWDRTKQHSVLAHNMTVIYDPWEL